jgi:hypothetical protein
MRILAITISIFALTISALTAWWTLWRRGQSRLIAGSILTGVPTQAGTSLTSTKKGRNSLQKIS